MKTVIALLATVCFSFHYANGAENILGSEEEHSFEEKGSNYVGYPTPPWTRYVYVAGTGFNQSSAQVLCQSDARSKIGNLEGICRKNGGSPVSMHPFCSICNKSGSQWRCTDNVRVSCGGGKRVINSDDELESESTDEEIGTDRGILWSKQLYDYARGSKYNKPPIRVLAEDRLQKQVEVLTTECLLANGTTTSNLNYLRWGCCALNSSRPCLYPGYPYPQDPGGCVAKIGASVTCSTSAD